MKRGCMLAWGAAVFALTAAAFLRSAECTLVNLDDYDYLPHVRQVENLGIGDVSQAIWMPLTWASYRFDLWAAGDSGRTTTADAGTVRFMHLHSVALHAVNAVLLWVLLCLLVNRGGGDGEQFRPLFAAFAALVWAVHPLRVESVAWVASRKDVLSMLWLLGALIFWVKWRMGNGEWGTGNRERGGRNAFYALSILCFVVGAMAKPSVMCFPALCLLMDWTMGRGLCDVARRGRWKTLGAYVVPCVLAGGVAVLAAYAQHAGGAMSSMADVPVWWKLVNAATAVGMYLKNTAWPVDLCCQNYMRYPALPRGWWFGVPICAVFAWWVWRRIEDEWRGLRSGESDCGGFALAGALCFAVAITPMLGVVGFGGHAFADRFTYIPAIGLSIAVVGLWKRGKGSGERRTVQPLIIIAVVAVITVLAAMTWRQVGYWKDDATLWAHTLEVDGDTNFMAHTVLGTYNFEFTHDLSKCIAHYERAIELDPDWSERSGVMYLIALAESGERQRLQDVFLKFNRWFKRKFKTGESVNQSIAEAAYQLGREDPTEPPGDGFRKAEKIVEESSDFAAKVPETGYLKYLLAKRRGDGVEAERLARELVADRLTTYGDAYLRFRFLEKEYPKKEGL